MKALNTEIDTDIKEIYDNLLDEESRNIFSKRDKGSGNTLQSSSQATGKNQKSIVSELY